MVVDKKLIKTYIVDDFTIYQGRSAIGNDILSTTLTDRGDLWFHSKGVPGSHVVIKTNGIKPTKEVIEMAIKVTTQYSKIKGNGVVIMVDGKYVSKEYGSNDGTVMVDHKKAKYFNVSK